MKHLLALLITLAVSGCANIETAEFDLSAEAVKKLYLLPTGTMEQVSQGGAANLGGLSIGYKSSKDKLAAFVDQLNREESDAVMAGVMSEALLNRYPANYELLAATNIDVKFTEWFNPDIRTDLPASIPIESGTYVVDFGVNELKYFASPFVADTISVSAGVRIIDPLNGSVVARSYYTSALSYTSLPKGFSDLTEQEQIEATRETLTKEYERVAAELMEDLLPGD